MLAQNDDNSNISALIDQWIEQENKGVEFPVPFDLAWQFAGYSTKANAKQSGLKGLKKDKHFSSQIMNKRSNNASGVSRSEYITLSLDAFKHICLMANTDEGEKVRDYFIECEKKWKLVQQTRPEVAEEVEVLRWKAEISKNEAIKAQAEQKTTELRHYVATALPKPLGDRILNVSVVKETEYIERTITPDGEVCDGVGITYIQKRYGFKSTKEAWGWLERIGMGKFSKIWKSEKKIVKASVIPRDCLKELDALFEESPRQMFLGE